VRGSIGAVRTRSGDTEFRVWAPSSPTVELHLLSPSDRRVSLAPEDHGYRAVSVPDLPVGSRYRYVLDRVGERADPASRAQPEGVGGPSAVVDLASHAWQDGGWTGRPLAEYVLYELHIGRFTAAGTLEAAARELPPLRSLGVTAVELMPVGTFPGRRNWGYDGVFPYAVQESYGGPTALQAFVDQAHRADLAVVLDVVYNHLGPEGNVLADFGPYFSDRHRIPWGAAINFDGPGSDDVRRYFLENALMWFIDFHIDALRLDAVHAIPDASATPFLEELASAVHEESGRRGQRPFYLIAESDQNDPRLLLPPTAGGFGIDGQWADDFHHALHVLATGEIQGYYADFTAPTALATAFERPFVYAGDRSLYRGRRHGRAIPDLAPERFVVCAQNHDQVGNRARGDRLAAGIPFERWKAVMGATLLSPYLPLLFMGDEYAETRPFPFFTDYSDPSLGRAARDGRREEFAAFGWPPVEVPDPQAPSTYAGAVLDRTARARPPHSFAETFVARLLALRRTHPALGAGGTTRASLLEEGRTFLIDRRRGDTTARLLLRIGAHGTSVQELSGLSEWRNVLWSADPLWGGPSNARPEGNVPGDMTGPLPTDLVAAFLPPKEGE
jgi:maltooligosyltrehalose trehalohydrolase